MQQRLITGTLLVAWVGSGLVGCSGGGRGDSPDPLAGIYSGTILDDSSDSAVVSVEGSEADAVTDGTMTVLAFQDIAITRSGSDGDHDDAVSRVRDTIVGNIDGLDCDDGSGVSGRGRGRACGEERS